MNPVRDASFAAPGSVDKAPGAIGGSRFSHGRDGDFGVSFLFHPRKESISRYSDSVTSPSDRSISTVT